LSDYLEDILDRGGRLDNVALIQCVRAASSLKFAMEQDKTGEATDRFASIFADLWQYLVAQCETSLATPTLYTVEIQETLSKHITVAAVDKSQAIEIAKTMYHDESVILGAENHVDTEFNIIEGE
jgi:hypothetical protein